MQIVLTFKAQSMIEQDMHALTVKVQAIGPAVFVGLSGWNIPKLAALECTSHSLKLAVAGSGAVVLQPAITHKVCSLSFNVLLQAHKPEELCVFFMSSTSAHAIQPLQPPVVKHKHSKNACIFFCSCCARSLCNLLFCVGVGSSYRTNANACSY